MFKLCLLVVLALVLCIEVSQAATVQEKYLDVIHERINVLRSYFANNLEDADAVELKQPLGEAGFTQFLRDLYAAQLAVAE